MAVAAAVAFAVPLTMTGFAGGAVIAFASGGRMMVSCIRLAGG